MFNLVRRQVAKYEVTVLTTTRGISHSFVSDSKINGFKIIRIPESAHFLETPVAPLFYRRLRQLIHSHDLVHIHNIVPSFTDFALLFATLKMKPTVLTYYNDPVSVGGILNRAATLGYARLSRYLTALPEHVVVIDWEYAMSSISLDTLRKLEVISPVPDDDILRAEGESKAHGVTRKTGNPRLLYAGKLIHYKGVDTLIEALAILKEKGLEIDCRIVGDGAMRCQLKEEIRKRSLEGSVSLLGWIPRTDLLALYRDSDVFVFPSCNRREAFGIAPMEALASGIPIVVSDIPGPRNLVLQSGAGSIFEPRSPESLARAIATTLDNYLTLRAKAEEFFPKLGNYDMVAEKYDELYMKSIGNRC